jgi:cellulose biosynthesis protein BcsQ
MTMYDMRTNLSHQVVGEIQTHFPAHIYDSLIPRSVRLAEAPSHGLPIIAYDPNCTGAAAYRQLAANSSSAARPPPPARGKRPRRRTRGDPPPPRQPS